MSQQDLGTHLLRAVSLHNAGRFDEAEVLYRKILRVQKHHPDATHRLAILIYQRGDTETALQLVGRALKMQPKFAAAHNSRGSMLAAVGRYPDALASFDQAATLNPAYVLAWINRGNTLAALGRFYDALASFDRAIAEQPSNAETFYAKGLFLQEHGRSKEAFGCYEQALAIRADYPEALNNRGALLDEAGRITEALADFSQALALRPQFAEALNNQGVLLDRIGRYDEARVNFERAVAARPTFMGARMNLADMLYKDGRRSEALFAIGRCLTLDPTDMKARMFRMIYQLPILYESEAEIVERRIAYETELRSLHELVMADPQPGRFAEVVGTQPFFLTYQGHSDRDLQWLYGAMICRIMASDIPKPLTAPRNGRRIRVGIVCGFFCQHPVWRAPLRGWVTQLDRSRFEVFGYHTGTRQDAETERAVASCQRFVQGPLKAPAWRARILADAPDILIYPEIGMDPMAAQLAAQRLAPVQCNSWGHPETSGMPTLDYFISSAEMEPHDGDEHYSERLVRLPGLGVYYEPREIHDIAITRKDMGARPDVPVFWCGQSLYKYLPQFDEIFPRIAREVGACQFIFISYHHGEVITKRLRKRLANTFAAFGLDASEHCVIMPRLDGNQFAAAIGQCDVVLDSVGWSGFNSSLEGLLHNRPIVTFDGALMRGRHTAAIMRVMGLSDAVAHTVDEYIDMAVSLARDPAEREEMSRRMSAAKDCAYRDHATIAALERFLEEAVSVASVKS